jgi:hypothetical protein
MVSELPQAGEKNSKVSWQTESYLLISLALVCSSSG